MNQPFKTRRNKKRLSLAALFGVFAVVPLLLTPASAVVDSHFLIKAQSDADSNIQAYAGLTGVTTPGTGGGAETPNMEPGTAVLTMNCGPMSLNITEQTLAYSKVAEDLIAADRSDEIQVNPEGWKVITSHDGTSIYNGLPPSGKPLVLVLGPYPFTGSDEGVVALGSEQGDSCQITDTRSTPKAGERITYRKDGASSYGEARYIQEEGKLRVANVFKSANSVAVSRSVDLSNNGKAPSDSYPGNFTLFNDGAIDAMAYPTNPLDGADEILMRHNADGSGYVDYRLLQAGAMTNRSNNPTQVWWNSDGEITKLVYSENGEYRELPAQDTPYTVEDYNRVTGQHWDGEYHTTSDYDLSLPFEVTAP